MEVAQGGGDIPSKKTTLRFLAMFFVTFSSLLIHLQACPFSDSYANDMESIELVTLLVRLQDEWRPHPLSLRAIASNAKAVLIISSGLISDRGLDPQGIGIALIILTSLCFVRALASSTLLAESPAPGTKPRSPCAWSFAGQFGTACFPRRRRRSRCATEAIQLSTKHRRDLEAFVMGSSGTGEALLWMPSRRFATLWQQRVLHNARLAL